MSVPRKSVKYALIALIALDLLALVAFAFRESRVTVRTVVPLAQSQLAAAPAPSNSTPPGSAMPPALPIVAVSTPLTQTTDPSHAGQHPTRLRHLSPASNSTKPSTVAGPAACPIKLQPPAKQGGLQSLISLSPAFGPLSAEAFAAASAYQPLLQLLGPILAQYPSMAPTLAPVVNPLVSAFGSGSTTLFSLIGPLYTPQRTQVLRAETQLAAYFAPYSEKLANSSLGGCIVDLEAALVSDTKKS